MKKKQLFLNGISVFLGLVFFSAGMSKLFFDHQFPGLIGPVWLEEKLAEFNLGLFARFIAFSQLTVGFMLLTLRYRTLGAIMLLPMVANILMITISQNWPGTPYIISFLLVLNLTLVVADGGKLLPLVGFTPKGEISPQISPLKMAFIWLAGFTVVLASVAVSHLHVLSGQLLSIAGVIIGFIPYFKQGRALRYITASAPQPEALSPEQQAKPAV